ncbi:small ribosomal subunit protein uS15m-like [Saccostrea cucullata]|uniref:small ribosomal subunit protein uS15m-like n=1 Tax=Saccostrea cuccullata TaxID=36930 RepID=UPI002ED45AA5
MRKRRKEYKKTSGHVVILKNLEQCIYGRILLFSSRKFTSTNPNCLCVANKAYINHNTCRQVKLLNHDAVLNTISVRYASYEEKKEKQKTHSQKMIEMFDLPTKKKKFETRKPFDYSGDVVEQTPLKDDEVLFIYRGLEDHFKDFPDNYKKVTTVEYADGQEKMAHRIWTMQEKFLNICKYGEKNEMIIAKKTIQIRNLLKHCQKNKKDGISKVILQEQIQGRQKELKKLRKADYQRFIWLLKELELKYKPHPLYVDVNSRRAKMRQYLREEACRKIREKIQTVYERLDDEKEKFYAEKEKQLAEIRKDLLEYNINDYEVLENVKVLRQQRVTERLNKPPPKPNTFKWIQVDKDAKKAQSREKEAHRQDMIRKGEERLKEMGEELN